MDNNQLFKNLSIPEGKIDVVLDTDTYNEVDDQYALSYMIKSSDKLNVKALYAAPFFNQNSASPEDGMIKSYNEILTFLKLCKREDLKEVTFKGSTTYLPDEKTPVISDAANHLVALAKNYSPENPLYVVAIATITNIASALLIAPEIAENIVIVWLGGHSLEVSNANEFNMVQDIAAARVVMNSNAPFVQLPCYGVVSSFTLSKAEILAYLKGKNELCDYLSDFTINEAEKYAKGTTWTRVIWDVTAVAWLLNDNNRFMASRIVNKYLPNYDNTYSQPIFDTYMRYVYYINRDELMNDLIDKLTK